VKVINSGIVDPQTGQITEGGFQKNDLQQIVAYACEKGFPVICHANGDHAVLNAIDAGASTIVHGFFITPKALIRMVENNVAFVPTIYAFYSLSKKNYAPHIRERIVTITGQHSLTVKMASDMGVRILAGSDASPSFLPYGTAFFEELRFLKAAGLGFEKTLMAAVKEPLKPGTQADFLVLDGLKIHSVFISGQRLTTS
jgi:imidazolonepropionase-like amidohydrolase